MQCSISVSTLIIYTCEWHKSKCDGKANTNTIIKNNLNYVFGGYASEAWHIKGGWVQDENAFIFSLRRNGISTNEKYKVAKPQKAYYGTVTWLFAFGGYDIDILANSNTETGSYTDFGNSYQLPEGYTYGSESAKNYLAGKDYSWLTTEIEVFQLEVSYFNSLILTSSEDQSLYEINQF